MGARLIVAALDRLDALVAAPQPASGATYAAKIDKAEARIDWTRPAPEIARLVRALSPFPGAWTEAGGERIKLLRARAVPGAGQPGQLIGPLVVACGEGAVAIGEAQREGRRPLPAADFLRGAALPARLG
jgi:methionyl-tRNA formyltransferase